ncbi:beta-ketoacyl-ACP synthase II [Latilactobacillus sakei]|uniref:beta-ketoacyl-ACP synthase II n=1 Tax=Latilactobacillus sakei TaxID=1599 RepID=UPI00115A3FFD|nr:beta-ketoacyl-ACP synthase II [Latilactobacillus sakei]VTU50526.1 beta-ketoacyl-[acyl-carrier-protein] synthase II [Latilactobacillus sakei]
MTRVVITGMGVVAPLGNDVETFTRRILAGELGIGPITKFDATTTGVSLAAEVLDFDPALRIGKKKAKRMDLFSQYALDSALAALEQAGINDENTVPADMGVIYGSGIGGLTTIQEQVTRMVEKGADHISPLFVPKSIGNMAAANIAIEIGAQNICTTIVTACSSGANAIGEAYRQIKENRATVMVTGGSEASINEIGIGGFAALSTLSTATDPTRASLPFDADRKGFVMGEGGATLILESLEHAQARHATILGEVTGYGTNCDAYHMTSPNPNGEVAAHAMQMAIDEAGITAADVDYVNAHGTGTVANELAESAALARVFGDEGTVPVSSTKSMTGHLLGAAGALEAIVTIGALQAGTLPPNVGLQNTDPDCHVNLIKTPLAAPDAQYGMSNSFGFGGHNAVLLLKKWSD